MFFKAKKTIISNPDEVILHYMKSPGQRSANQINRVDTDDLVSVLNRFDLQTVCKVLMILPSDKTLSILDRMNDERRAEIIRRLPSNLAAQFIKEFEDHTP